MHQCQVYDDDVLILNGLYSNSDRNSRMTKRKRAADIRDVIKASNDPAAIMGQICKRLGLPEDAPPRPGRGHSSDRRASVAVQTDDLGVLCEHSVSAWLFGPPPGVRDFPGAVALSEPRAVEVPDDSRLSKLGVDDGTFPSDPVLLLLRRRLRDSLAAPRASKSGSLDNP
jgi:hypothetical protein